MSSLRRLQHVISHLNASKTNSYHDDLEYVFITGCSRGIGLGLVENFLKSKSNNYFVIATCRSPNNANQLKSLLSQYSNRSKLIKLDVSNENSIINVFEQIRNNKLKIDIMINNAAIVASVLRTHDKETVINFSKDEMQNILNVNLIGPALIFRNCFNNNLFNRNARVINITSSAGSIAMLTDGNDAFNGTSYRLSKVGLNMLTAMQQIQIGNKHNLKVCCIDPGHVNTTMGTEQSGFDTAPLTVHQSCTGIIKIVENMKYSTKYNAKYLKYDGTFLH
eukprot:196212_1